MKNIHEIGIPEKKKVRRRVFVEIMCCDLVKLTFIKQTLGYQMVSYSSAKNHKGIKIEKCISNRSWRKYMSCLKGLPGAHCLYQDPWVGCFEVPKLSLDQSMETKKNRVLVSSKVVSSNGPTWGRPWEVGETITRDLRKSYPQGA